jgi:signal transduction histidine kinase
MDLAHLRRETGRDEVKRRAQLEEASRILGETLETVRGISQDLHPRILDDLGLVAAVKAHARRLCGRAGMGCQVKVDTDDAPLDPREALALYRVYCEAMTNVARHASAQNVNVSLHERKGWVELTVEDDGRGLPPRNGSKRHSLGVLYMQEAMRALGGSCEVTSPPGRGTIVTVRVPAAARSRTEPPDAPHEEPENG